MAKRRRGGRDSPRRAMESPHQGHAEIQGRPHPEIQGRPRPEIQERPHREKRLYLILDDHPFGYNIRKIPRQTRSSRENTAASGNVTVRRMPRPIVSLDGQRGCPMYFAAVGTRILSSQCIDPFDLMCTFDVRSLTVNFGPALSECPIYLPVGDELFALDVYFWKLSFKPECPPQPSNWDPVPWSWCELPCHQDFFNKLDVTSYTVHSDGQTILFSTNICSYCSAAAAATFSFDTKALMWEKHNDWALPFDGRAYFVPCLEAYVGLSKDPVTLGQLASCKATKSLALAEWKLSKENLFSKDPAEIHIGATLVYMGGSEFCLVQCVSVKHELLIEEPSPSCCYRYRLTTFSLSYDNSGGLTIGETSRVQCYEVPRGTTDQFINGDNPVAFWL